MGPGTHVTLASSAGPIWLALLVHVLGGAIAIVAGYTAVVVAKGAKRHRQAGLVFVFSMIAMAAFATVVGTYEMKATAVGGVLTGYFVFTGLTTVRPLAGTGRTQHTILMSVALLIALFEITVGIVALGRPHAMLHGVPAGMFLFLGTVALLAANGDWRMIRAGGIRGTKRLARHLWRMCFALFIASGSFFFGQTRFVPASLRIVPLLSLLGVAPLFLLIYWMWRVRLRESLRGMTFNDAAEMATRVKGLVTTST